MSSWLPSLRCAAGPGQPADPPPSLYLEHFHADRWEGRDNLLALARMATLSYLDPQKQKEIAGLQAETRHFEVLDSKNNARLGCQAPDTGTQVSVLETEDAVLVAPRGTPLALSSNPDVNLQWADLINDLNAFPTQNYTHTGRVHRGFKRATDGIWEQLKPILEKAGRYHKEVHLVGHSLGAAIATHIADRMHDELHQLPRSLVTLGSPAVGWKDEQKHLRAIGLDQRTTRVVNDLDPVPGAFLGGGHIGKVVYFDYNGAAHINPERHSGWAAARDALFHLRLNPLQGHYPKLYVERIVDERNRAVLDS